MKKKSIISLLICCMTLGMVNTSCQDMLTPDSERHAYTVAQDTLYSYWGIIKSLQHIAERYVILNECRGDLVDGTSYVSDTIGAIINFGKNGFEDKYKDGECAYLKVSDYYHVINSCNSYIAKCDTARKVSTGQQKSYMSREYAQVLAIRAWVYMQLVYAYGNVPFYKEPLLTTDDINNFITDPNHDMADAKTLAGLLAPDLEEMFIRLGAQETEEMYPQYNNYRGVCHSMRTMFPLTLVLGDLYLMQGDQTGCEKAASFYYEFLNSKFGGPLECSKYICTGNVVATKDDPQYDWNGDPYEESTHSLTGGRYRNEAITCIPCNYGRLDGLVFTDICRLFGFEATLASGSAIIENDDDTETKVSVNAVSLNYGTNGYRRELIPSKGYEALCDSQKYEYYIGSTPTEAFQQLDTLPGVGDARRAWTLRCRGIRQVPLSSQFSMTVGDDTQYGKFIHKQCPDGFFSNVYPVIYRKSTVWLRYAEAINRAGYPSYAFAILKNGLTSSNDQWFPSPGIDGNVYAYNASPDYGVKDSIYYYKAEDIGKTWGLNDGVEITTYDSLKTYVEAKYLAYADSVNATLEEGETPYVPAPFNDNNISFKAKSYNNYPADYCLKALWFLDRREVKDIQEKQLRWMNYNNQPYLQGYVTSISPYYKKNTWDSGYNIAQSENVSGASTSTDYLTIGVHQRGCGILRPGDPERWSSFDYVTLVTKKIRENHGVTVTKEQIYGQDTENPIDKTWVQEAVEDIIIDEDGLELAFEGCRFSDLARVAIRRGDASFLAKRVAKRSGSFDQKLYDILMQPSNWYLPFPTE
ncbi:MAG: hypothetical protein J6W52_11190 [Bacteroidaceae bacterium]|nr:hypothetical protein [Bacteroidaceae bacterium]